MSSILWLLREHLHVGVADLFLDPAPVLDLEPYAGRYSSNQFGVDISVVAGQLEEDATYEPLDDIQARIFSGSRGGLVAVHPHRLVPIGKDLFAPGGCSRGIQRLLGEAACLIPRVERVAMGGIGATGGRMMRTV